MLLSANIDSMLNHLENAQWWPPDIMRRRQFELLTPLAEHAYRTVPWYRRQFDSIGIAPDRIAEEDSWRRVPLLTRFDIQDAGEALYSTSLPSEHGKTTPIWTGGSTATSVRVLTTEVTMRFWNANEIRQHQWHRRDFTKKYAVIRPLPPGKADPPNGLRLDSWGLATVAAKIPTGPCVVLNAESSTADQAEWLLREQPVYLQMYPSVAFEVANHFLARGLRLPGLEHVHTWGEVLEPQVRNACRMAWGVDVFDGYSASEVGHIGMECDQQAGYHVQSEHLLVEILDDAGRDCESGEIGRVVVTDLFNYATPLLRYEIGDYAEVGPPCPCGRKLPTLRRILGRQRNMFHLPGGERRWPALSVDAVGFFEGSFPVRQFQVIQHSLSDIEVKLVVFRPLLPKEESAVGQMLASWFGDSFSVRFTYVDQISRGPTGKFEDFRCEIQSDR